MTIINLQYQSLTLDDVIELARQDPVSIVTRRGEEVYVAHLGQQGATPTRIESNPMQSKHPVTGAMTQEEVEEAIDDELARFEARLLSK